MAVFFSASRSLPARRGRSIFAAQSNLAFLGMWIELTPIELAAFLFSILDSECLPGTAKVFFGLILLFFLFSDGYVFDWKVDRV